MQVLRRHAAAIIDQYDGLLPLPAFINAYYKQHPVLGSKDRKIITERVFTFYRIAPLIKQYDAGQQAYCVDAFMAERLSDNLLKNALKDSRWIESGQTLDERIALLQQNGIEIHLESMVLHFQALSEGIDTSIYAKYLLARNAVFIKPHAKFGKMINAALEKYNVAFTALDNGLLRVDGATKLQEMLQPGWYRIQDASSVETADYFPNSNPQKVWDTCAGGGGKSLLLMEKYPDAVLHVSDNRSFKLENLKKRFREHGYRMPVCFEWDGETETSTSPNGAPYDIILCDVPCSGSGTWARNPEGAYFFKPEMLQSLVKKQQSIVNNAIKNLKPGGYLVYITCSVFRAENEDMIDQISTTGALTIQSQIVINGMDKQADFLFVALLKK
jgi:16S rRNA (cytosine967-C5)-methyltransferase